MSTALSGGRLDSWTGGKGCNTAWRSGKSPRAEGEQLRAAVLHRVRLHSGGDTDQYEYFLEIEHHQSVFFPIQINVAESYVPLTVSRIFVSHNYDSSNFQC